ncbi:MAG: dihydrolipoyl dehydrogenase [Neisseriaceae bacterium]
MKTLKADVVIIGGGSAGMSAYRAARRHTDSILIIEGVQWGTTCARAGCMPSKLLVAAARAVQDTRKFKTLGIKIDGRIKVNGQAVMNRLKTERDRFVGFVLETIKSYGADHILNGWAEFIDANTVLVNGETRVEGKTFILATGSRPRILPEWKKLGCKLQSSEKVFHWNDLPKSIAVVGTGAIGLELGQALAHLGVKTHLFSHSEHIAFLSDPKVVQKARSIFAHDLELHFKTEPKFSLEGEGVRVEYNEGGKAYSDHVDLILAVAGRIPNIDKMSLEKTGVAVNERGVPIVADPYTMQTSVPHIFIAGDASGILPLKHIASEQGAIAGSNAAKYPKIEKGLIRVPLGIIFSEPQIITVGDLYRDLNLQETIIGEVEFENQGRSRIMQVNQGTLRVYFDRTSRRLIGAEGVGPDAEHLGHLLAWSKQSGLTINQMLDMPFYHPVIEEGLETALKHAKRQWS